MHQGSFEVGVQIFYRYFCHPSVEFNGKWHDTTVKIDYQSSLADRRNMSLPLLIVDSGSGGFSLLDEIRLQIPELSFTYAADYAGCPYGDRDSTDIMKRVFSLVDAVQSSRTHGMLLVACNTASTLILEHLRHRYTIPVVGVVPSVKPAFERYPRGKILLLATPHTVDGKYLEGLVSKHSGGTKLYRYGNTDLVRLAEKSLTIGTDSSEVEEVLAPLEQRSFDAVVLGCTHFSLIKDQLQDIFKGAELIDSAKGIASRIDAVAKGSLARGNEQILYVTSQETPSIDYLRSLGFLDKNLIEL